MAKHLQIKNVNQIISKIESHFQNNSENFNEEDINRILHGENGLDKIKELSENVKNISDPFYIPGENNEYKTLNDEDLKKLNESYNYLSDTFSKLKKNYMDKSTSKELLAWFEIFETKMKDDINVLKSIHPEDGVTLPEAVEKNTKLPNGYNYEQHLKNVTRAVKRKYQLNDLAETANKDSALRKLSDKINTLKSENILLDEKETRNLIGLYAEAGIELKRITDNNKDNPEKYNFYKKMILKFSKDYAALHKYMRNIEKTDKPNYLSIDGFFDMAKTRTIKLSNTELTELEKSGAGQNIRYKINVKCQDEPIEGVAKGEIFTGYFTEDIRIDTTKKHKEVENPKVSNNIISEEAHNKILDYLSLKYPDAREFINTRLKTGKADVYAFCGSEHEKTLRLNVNQLISLNGSDALKRLMMKYYASTKNRTAAGHNTISVISNETEMLAYMEYANLYMKQSLSEGINRSNQINSKCAQGQRNALVSALADVFGCGDYVAFSEKVKVELLEHNKKVQKKGVLMMPAKGIDRGGADCSSNITKLNYFSVEESPEFVKAASSLQFLDYIIGNTDRHTGNFFFQINDEGKFTGVQGIDNDTVGGAKKDLDHHNSAVAFENLRIIPKSMANAVMNLKPEVFEILLQGYDMNENEINNTLDNFKKLKEKLKNCEKAYVGTEPGFLDPKVPRIVADEDMAKYSVNEQLTYIDEKHKSQHNIFGKLTSFTQNPFHGIEKALENDKNSSYKLAAELQMTHSEKSYGSIYKNLVDLSKISKTIKFGGENKKDRKKALDNLIKKAKVIFELRYSEIDMVTFERHNISKQNLIVKGTSFDEVRTVYENAVKSANEFLGESSDAVLDYQNCKAEIDYYKSTGETDKMSESMKTLKSLEKNPEVKQYQLAVKIRDKYMNLLDKMDKIEKNIEDMKLGNEKYIAIKAQAKQKIAEYNDSDYRKNTLKRIEELNKRNKLNNTKEVKNETGKVIGK